MIYATVCLRTLQRKTNVSPRPRMHLRNTGEGARQPPLARCGAWAPRAPLPRPPTGRPPRRPRSPPGLSRSAARSLTDTGSARQRNVKNGGGRTRRSDGRLRRGRGHRQHSTRVVWFRPRRARRRRGFPVPARCDADDDGGSRVPRRRREWDGVARCHAQEPCALRFEPAVESA